METDVSQTDRKDEDEAYCEVKKCTGFCPLLMSWSSSFLLNRCSNLPLEDYYARLLSLFPPLINLHDGCQALAPLLMHMLVDGFQPTRRMVPPLLVVLIYLSACFFLCAVFLL